MEIIFYEGQSIEQIKGDLQMIIRWLDGIQKGESDITLMDVIDVLKECVLDRLAITCGGLNLPE